MRSFAARDYGASVLQARPCELAYRYISASNVIKVSNSDVKVSFKVNNRVTCFKGLCRTTALFGDSSKYTEKNSVAKLRPHRCRHDL
jgi:hypothetical protein